MKTILTAAASAALLSVLTSPAHAEEWTDWKPIKEAVRHTYVPVEPGHLDEYMMALKKTWVPEEELLKKKGVLSNWAIQVREDQSGPGPNVTLVEWYPSRAAWDPDEARDREMMAAARALVPKDQLPAMAAERAKYRKILGETNWTEVEFPK